MSEENTMTTQDDAMTTDDGSAAADDARLATSIQADPAKAAREIRRLRNESNQWRLKTREAQQQGEQAEQTRAELFRLRVEKQSKGRLRDPGDLLLLAPELGPDSNEQDVSEAIDRLVSEKPYLAPDLEPAKPSQPPKDGWAKFAELLSPERSLLNPEGMHNEALNRMAQAFNPYGEI